MLCSSLKLDSKINIGYLYFYGCKWRRFRKINSRRSDRAVLGALLSKDEEEGATVNATREAHKAALQTKEPVLVAIKGKLYKPHPDGRKHSYTLLCENIW